MPTWLPRILQQIRHHAARGTVVFTQKARAELAALGSQPDDALDVLRGLTEEDFFQRLRSDQSGEWLYVFKPFLVGLVVYLKVVLRVNCVVISFHEDDDEDEEE